MNERMNEWINELMNEWTNEWMERRTNGRIDKRKNERISEWMNDLPSIFHDDGGPKNTTKEDVLKYFVHYTDVLCLTF